MECNELEFSQLIANAFKDDGFLAKTEIDAGYGIADVVAIKINRKRIIKRLQYKQLISLNSECYFKVLGLLGEDNKSAISGDDIVEKLSFSSGYLKSKVIKELTSENFIQDIGNKTYIKVNGWAPLSDEIIAVESKLHDWNRGLTQAIRYKTFANKVYLALPKENVHLVNKKLLKSMNIGLLTLDNGRLVKIFTPMNQNRKIIPSKQNYVCECFWYEMQSI